MRSAGDSPGRHLPAAHRGQFRRSIAKTRLIQRPGAKFSMNHLSMRKVLISGLISMTLSILSSSEAQPVPVDPSLPPYRPGVQVAGTLDGLCGMDTVQAMMKAWNEAFQKYHPGANVTVESKDPLGPEERIALGPHTAELFNPDYQAYEDAYGYEPFRVKFCMGAHILKSHVSAIGVYVN